jgi:hypothetical protein
VSTEHRTVQVKILETEYIPEERVKHVTKINGKRKIRYTYKAAKYTVIVEYNNESYTFRDKTYYSKAENKENTNINGMLEIKSYDDNSSDEYIINIFVE